MLFMARPIRFPFSTMKTSQSGNGSAFRRLNQKLNKRLRFRSIRIDTWFGHTFILSTVRLPLCSAGRSRGHGFGHRHYSINCVLADAGTFFCKDWQAAARRIRWHVPCCLTNKAHVLHPEGNLFKDSTIGDALAMRDLMDGLRQGGTNNGGPAPRLPRIALVFCPISICAPPTSRSSCDRGR